MAALNLLILGSVFVGRIPVDLLPQITYPTVRVNVQSPGQEPMVLEETIAKPLEAPYQPGKGPQRRLAAGEVQELEVRRSVGVGTQQFHRVEARLPAPGQRRIGKRFRIASMVRGDEAANELVTWLEERLTRPRK